MVPTATASQPNRVSYSFGMKLSLPAKYESADFHVSLTSDLNPGESAQQAFDRIKEEVLTYATASYNRIRASETGLGEHVNPTPIKTQPQASQEATATVKPKALEDKVIRQKIKAALGVLEAKKQVTKADFVSTYLNNKKLADLTELEVTKAIVNLREKYPELNL